MLSRVADSLFWLGRNIERAETVSRILDVNYTRSMDHYSSSDGRSEKLWRSVVGCTGFVSPTEADRARASVTEAFEYCALDPDNATSILSAVRIARSNALGIRAELTTEVWEQVNVLYLYVEEHRTRFLLREGPSKFLRRVRDYTQAFAGISDATMTHGDGWNFLQVGRYLERAYMGARILEAIDVEGEPWPESQRLLEMCCAAVPFAQSSHRTPDPRDAIAFIVLSQRFPRSIRFCTREIESAMHRISRTPEGTFATPAERRLGRLRAFLDYASIEEIMERGVPAFARGLVEDIGGLSSDIESAYFPRLPVPA